jgi:hypothetical protein
MSCRRTSLARPAPTLQVCSGRIGDPILAFRTLGRIAALVMSQRRTSYADQTEHLLDREAVRGPDQFGAALLRAGGEQFERASVVRVAPAWAGGGSVWSSLALRAAAPAFPTTSRCFSCHPTRQSSIQRKISEMKSAGKSSRTTPSNPSMRCAESSSRRSSISCAIPKPSNPSPHCHTSSGHLHMEVV